MLEAVGQVDASRREEPAVTRVRADDPVSAELLREGLRRSSTIRDLVAGIEATDLLVVLAKWHERAPRGQMQVTSAGTGGRVAIVRVSLFLTQDERIAGLGHELQHVQEIAAAPGVTNGEAVARLFERIGHRTSWSEMRYETAAALAIEHRVREEIRRVR
jgi:hypothetical protein